MTTTYKEMLMCLVNTLTEKTAKQYYLMIKELDEDKGKWWMFDVHGVHNEAEGNVKLTPKQFNKLVFMWGEDKARKCISILSKYLSDKQPKCTSSHYTMLNGWVEQLYHKQQLQKKQQTTIPFNEIRTIGQAKFYVSKIPLNLRYSDTYVEFLVNKFGKEILDV